VGYAIGGGLEFKLSEGVSLKGEYLYVDLGSRSVTTTDTGLSAVLGTPATFKARSEFDANLFRVGINFDLNRPAPPLK
jgi:outer membrane immunogenic protein